LARSTYQEITMPTLAQLIAAHEAAQPATTRVVLTPRSEVAVQILCLERALAELCPSDRAYVVGRLRALLADVTATA
jgi:hypothetical protein